MENRRENSQASLFVFAHRPEAKAFIAALGFKPDLRPNLLKSEQSGDWLLISGEGISSALAEASFAMGLLSGQISRVLNFGVAASLRPDIKVDQIVQVRTIYGLKQSQNSEFKSFTTASSDAAYDCISSEKRILDSESKNRLLPIADIVDREAWGIGWSARSCSLSFFVIKIISDLADDSQACELIASSADRYSSALYQYYLDKFAPQLLDKPAIGSSKPRPLERSLCHIDLGLAFHVTTTQSRQISTLLERLALKSGSTADILLDNFLHNDVVSQIKLAPNSPKSKTKEFIQFLSCELNPHLAATKQSIAEILKPIQSDGCKISCDPSLEESGFKVEVRVKSADELRKIQTTLVNLPFDELEALLCGGANDHV